MIGWLRRTPDVPHRREVLDRIAALPVLPEAERMQTKAMERAKPRTFQEWAERHDKQRRAS